jgi:hypothetical protein
MNQTAWEPGSAGAVHGRRRPRCVVQSRERQTTNRTGPIGQAFIATPSQGDASRRMFRPTLLLQPIRGPLQAGCLTAPSIHFPREASLQEHCHPLVPTGARRVDGGGVPGIEHLVIRTRGFPFAGPATQDRPPRGALEAELPESATGRTQEAKCPRPVSVCGKVGGALHPRGTLLSPAPGVSRSPHCARCGTRSGPTSPGPRYHAGRCRRWTSAAGTLVSGARPGSQPTCCAAHNGSSILLDVSPPALPS